MSGRTWEFELVIINDTRPNRNYTIQNGTPMIMAKSSAQISGYNGEMREEKRTFVWKGGDNGWREVEEITNKELLKYLTIIPISPSMVKQLGKTMFSRPPKLDTYNNPSG